MKTLTQEQYDNLTLVRDTLNAKIKAEEPDYLLNDFLQPCGSHGCVLGDYMLAKVGPEKGQVETSSHFNTCFVDRELQEEMTGLYRKPELRINEFGWALESHRRPGRYSLDVFGGSCAGTLEERLAHVQFCLENSHVNPA